MSRKGFATHNLQQNLNKSFEEPCVSARNAFLSFEISKFENRIIREHRYTEAIRQRVQDGEMFSAGLLANQHKILVLIIGNLVAPAISCATKRAPRI